MRCAACGAIIGDTRDAAELHWRARHRDQPRSWPARSGLPPAPPDITARRQPPLWRHAGRRKRPVAGTEMG